MGISILATLSLWAIGTIYFIILYFRHDSRLEQDCSNAAMNLFMILVFYLGGCAYLFKTKEAQGTIAAFSLSFLALIIVSFIVSDISIKKKRERIKNEYAELRSRAAAIRKEEQVERDADAQVAPATYSIGRHALETLALRYGIPHLAKDTKGRTIEAKSIRIQKIKSLGRDKYSAILPDYRNREVVVVIEKGTYYVKTFYPISGQIWFSQNSDWETSLKGNSGFTIKDMAKMHFDRINRMKN